jgi:hypothetical protein
MSKRLEAMIQLFRKSKYDEQRPRWGPSVDSAETLTLTRREELSVEDSMSLANIECLYARSNLLETSLSTTSPSLPMARIPHERLYLVQPIRQSCCPVSISAVPVRHKRSWQTRDMPDAASQVACSRLDRRHGAWLPQEL